MDRKIFLQEFEMRAKKEFPEEDVRVYENGFLPITKEDEVFVASTNAKYAKKESHRLIGDFATITNGSMTARLELEFLTSLADGTDAGWDKIFSMIQEALSNRDDAKNAVDWALEDPEKLKDYGLAKKMLFIRLLNFTDNQLALKDAVYTVIGDIAKVLYLKLSDDGKDLKSMKVSAGLFNAWGIAEEEVWEKAMLNTFSEAMPRIYVGSDECVDPPYQKGAFLNRKFSIRKADIPMLTTTRQTNGAIAVFYPGVAERVAELLHGDFLIAFTSVDEAILHRIGQCDPKDILSTIHAVNRRCNMHNGMLLTRQVYRYSRKAGKIEALDITTK